MWRCDDVWGILWVSEDDGGGHGTLINEVERVGRRKCGSCKSMS